MENVLNFTGAEIEKITQNYLMSVSNGHIKILKFIKAFSFISLTNNQAIEVHVKVINRFGKKTTEKIYIVDTPDFSNVSGYDFIRKSPLELLNMDLLPNTEFTMSFEDAIAERNVIESLRKHKEFISNIARELDYNIRQKRKPSASKRSYKKYDIEKLESILDELSTTQQNYLLSVIDALRSDEMPKQTVKQFIASFTGVKKELLEAIELSFLEAQQYSFDKYIEYLKTEDMFKDATVEVLNKEAFDYIEMQKWNLFKAVLNYLNNLDITRFETIRIANRHNGFEGDWKLFCSDGSIKYFETKTIIAGGNIQRLHYRYLVNLS